MKTFVILLCVILSWAIADLMALLIYQFWKHKKKKQDPPDQN